MPYDSANVRRVVERINDAIVSNGEPPDEMRVSDAEYADCETAVLMWLKERGMSPHPFTRTGRGILFKNVEIYTE